jgi:inosine/xanthosine triphosphatase
MLEREIKRYSAYFRGWCQTFGEHESIPGDKNGINWLLCDHQAGFILPKKLTKSLYREILLHPETPTMKISGNQVKIGSFEFTLEKNQEQRTLEVIEGILENNKEFHVYLTSHFMYGTDARIITLSSKKPLGIIYKEVGKMRILIDEHIHTSGETKHVVVASQNPAKMRAVQEALSVQFPGYPVGYTAVDADSDVSDQPVSDEETRQGAINRAQHAKQTHPDKDYWVGLEGGIETFEDQLMAFAWMAILDNGGKQSISRTVSLPLPPAVRDLINQGMELGEANDQVFSTVNSKHEGGAFGLLTDGLYTREGVYAQALILALLPFVHKLYQTTAGSQSRHPPSLPSG